MRSRLTTSGIKARLLLLLLRGVSNPISFRCFFFFFFFEQERRQGWGKFRVYISHDNGGTVSRYILFRMWFLRNWKPRHKCFPSVWRLTSPILPFFCLSTFLFLPQPSRFSHNSSARRIDGPEEWAITESELPFLPSLFRRIIFRFNNLSSVRSSLVIRC